MRNRLIGTLLKASMPQLDTDEENVATIAEGLTLPSIPPSFSHAMAIFPFRLLDVAQGAERCRDSQVNHKAPYRCGTGLVVQRLPIAG